MKPAQDKRMALSLRNPVAREWVAHQREKVRPWSEFLDFSSFRKPESPQELKRIFLKNIEVYHANYMVKENLLRFIETTYFRF